MDGFLRVISDDAAHVAQLRHELADRRDNVLTKFRDIPDRKDARNHQTAPHKRGSSTLPE